MSESPAYYPLEEGISPLCFICAPEDAEPEGHPPEVDYPLHCSRCNRPLDHSLTEDGVQYVLEALKGELDTTIYNGRDSWYDGSPRYQIHLDWADDLRSYCHSSDEEEILEDFFRRIDDVRRE